MLDSRFYYADAAAQRYVKLMMDEAKVTEPELTKVVDDVNLAVL